MTDENDIERKEKPIIWNLNRIFNCINEIGETDAACGKMLLESFTIALGAMKTAAENGGKREKIDLDEQLHLVSDVLKIDFEQLVQHILETKFAANDINKKAADEETMEFITAAAEDVDDYEKFLEENKVQENITFLSKEV